MPSLQAHIEDIIKRVLHDLDLLHLDPDPKVKKSKIEGVDYQYDGLIKILRNRHADQRN